MHNPNRGVMLDREENCSSFDSETGWGFTVSCLLLVFRFRIEDKDMFVFFGEITGSLLVQFIGYQQVQTCLVFLKKFKNLEKGKGRAGFRLQSVKWKFCRSDLCKVF